MNDLDQTRRQLGQIPALAAKLHQFLTGTTPTGDEAGSKRLPAGSKPPVNLALIDLIDGRDIHNWVRIVYETMTDLHYEQPGPANWNDLATCCQWLAQHADWIAEEFPETQPIKQDLYQCSLHCPDGHYLTSKRVTKRHGRQHCNMCPIGFISDIAALHWRYRRAARELPDARLNCLVCGNQAFIDGEWFICREVEEHARTIKDIEHEYRFAPKATTAQVAEQLHISQDVIHQWRSRGKGTPPKKLQPAEKRGRTLYWRPWDVFCFLHPAVAEAIEARDTAAADA